MRNKERIQHTTRLFETFWAMHPDLRLSQIVGLIEAEARQLTQADFYYVEDDMVATILERLIEQGPISVPSNPDIDWKEVIKNI